MDAEGEKGDKEEQTTNSNSTPPNNITTTKKKHTLTASSKPFIPNQSKTTNQTTTNSTAEVSLDGHEQQQQTQNDSSHSHSPPQPKSLSSPTPTPTAATTTATAPATEHPADAGVMAQRRHQRSATTAANLTTTSSSSSSSPTNSSTVQQQQHQNNPITLELCGQEGVIGQPQQQDHQQSQQEPSTTNTNPPSDQMQQHEQTQSHPKQNKCDDYTQDEIKETDTPQAVNTSSTSQQHNQTNNNQNQVTKPNTRLPTVTTSSAPQPTQSLSSMPDSCPMPSLPSILSSSREDREDSHDDEEWEGDWEEEDEWQGLDSDEDMFTGWGAEQPDRDEQNLGILAWFVFRSNTAFGYADCYVTQSYKNIGDNRQNPPDSELTFWDIRTKKERKTARKKGETVVVYPERAEYSFLKGVAPGRMVHKIHEFQPRYTRADPNDIDLANISRYDGKVHGKFGGRVSGKSYTEGVFVDFKCGLNSVFIPASLNEVPNGFRPPRDMWVNFNGVDKGFGFIAPERFAVSPWNFGEMTNQVSDPIWDKINTEEQEDHVVLLIGDGKHPETELSLSAREMIHYHINAGMPLELLVQAVVSKIRVKAMKVQKAMRDNEHEGMEFHQPLVQEYTRLTGKIEALMTKTKAIHLVLSTMHFDQQSWANTMNEYWTKSSQEFNVVRASIVVDYKAEGWANGVFYSLNAYGSRWVERRHQDHTDHFDLYDTPAPRAQDGSNSTISKAMGTRVMERTANGANGVRTFPRLTFNRMTDSPRPQQGTNALDPYVLRVQYFRQDTTKAKELLDGLLARANGFLTSTDNPDSFPGMTGTAITLVHNPVGEQRDTAIAQLRKMAQEMTRTGYMFAMLNHDLISNDVNMINVLLARHAVFDTPTLAALLGDPRSHNMQMLAYPISNKEIRVMLSIHPEHRTQSRCEALTKELVTSFKEFNTRTAKQATSMYTGQRRAPVITPIWAIYKEPTIKFEGDTPVMQEGTGFVQFMSAKPTPLAPTNAWQTRSAAFTNSFTAYYLYIQGSFSGMSQTTIIALLQAMGVSPNDPTGKGAAWVTRTRKGITQKNKILRLAFSTQEQQVKAQAATPIVVNAGVTLTFSMELGDRESTQDSFQGMAIKPAMILDTFPNLAEMVPQQFNQVGKDRRSAASMRIIEAIRRDRAKVPLDKALQAQNKARPTTGGKQNNAGQQAAKTKEDAKAAEEAKRREEAKHDRDTSTAPEQWHRVGPGARTKRSDSTRNKTDGVTITGGGYEALNNEDQEEDEEMIDLTGAKDAEEKQNDQASGTKTASNKKTSKKKMNSKSKNTGKQGNGTGANKKRARSNSTGSLTSTLHEQTQGAQTLARDSTSSSKAITSKHSSSNSNSSNNSSSNSSNSNSSSSSSRKSSNRSTSSSSSNSSSSSSGNNGSSSNGSKRSSSSSSRGSSSSNGIGQNKGKKRSASLDRGSGRRGAALQKFDRLWQKAKKGQGGGGGDEGGERGGQEGGNGDYDARQMPPPPPPSPPKRSQW